MAASKKASKARDAAEGAWTNPYVQRLVQDEDLREDVRVAYDNLRSASVALREGQQKPKKRRLGRLLLLGLVGAGLAIAVSEDLRNKVLDALFGAEEEFDYTSTTAPSTSAPSQPQAAGTT